ncbi:MAG: hypothetical protein QXZ17_14340 [Nitrososphaerota archaeon]
MGYVPPSSALKFDSNGNVLANLNAQNIDPTIANPYSPTLLSHQTGLSITASTAGTFYAIGSNISVPRNGIAVISMSGHVNAGEGYIQLELTRGSSSYYFGTYNSAHGPSLFGNTGDYSVDNYISATSSTALFTSGNFNSTNSLPSGSAPSFILPVYSSDSLQFYATNSTASDVTYIDDVLVMLI